jgi:hypothetical protein
VRSEDNYFSEEETIFLFPLCFYHTTSLYYRWPWFFSVLFSQGDNDILTLLAVPVQCLFDLCTYLGGIDTFLVAFAHVDTIRSK